MSTYSFISTSKIDIVRQIASDHNLTVRLIKIKAKGPTFFGVDAEIDQLVKFDASLKSIKIWHTGFTEMN